MKCVECGKGELVYGMRDVRFRYRGRETFIKDIEGKYCTHCGMGYYGPDDDPDQLLLKGMDAFEAQVDAELGERRTDRDDSDQGKA